MNEYKTRSENKNTKNEWKKYSLKSHFFGSNRLFVLVYSDQDDNSKRFKTGIYYLRKGIIIIYNITIYGKKIMTNPLIQI